MVALVILSFMMAVVFIIISGTGKIWRNSMAKIEAFQAARAGFEAMTRRLSQATLNNYYDYFDVGGHAAADPDYSGIPNRYGRQSELHFAADTGLLPRQVSSAVFFQALLGQTSDSAWEDLPNALNAVGYYVTYNSDVEAGSRPGFISAALTPLKWRFRLMEYVQPLQSLEIYKTANITGNGWFATGSMAAGNVSNTRALADNIVCLVILPKKSSLDDESVTELSPDYVYNSRVTWTGTRQPEQMNQLPPLVQVVMVAIDEPSAQRICLNAEVPDLGVESLFRQAARLEEDLRLLTTTLEQERINYQVFRANIAIRGAKWSR
jgi:uncharacterized protein (TIGR02599 family)